MRKHAKHYNAHVNSFSKAQKSFLCACKSFFYIRDSVCCHLEKTNGKIFTEDYYIPNIKLKIMLYEPFM